MTPWYWAKRFVWEVRNPLVGRKREPASMGSGTARSRCGATVLHPLRGLEVVPQKFVADLEIQK